MRSMILIFLSLLTVAALYWGKNAHGDPLVPLGRIWFDLAPASLNRTQSVLERYVAAWLWDALFFLLQAPAALAPLALIILLALTGLLRRKG